MRRFLTVLFFLLLGALLFVVLKKDTPQQSTPTPTKNKSTTTSHAKAPPNRTLTARDNTSIDADYQDDPTGALQLEGQVVDEEGNAVAGASVGLSSHPTRQTISDKDGRFAFGALSRRNYYLTASKGDLFGETVAPVSEESIPVTVRVFQGNTIEVTVLDELDRHPIADAEISWGDSLPQSASTNQEGKAILRGLDRWLSFRVSADGYGPQRVDAQTNATPGGMGHQTVLLSPGAKVSGLVLDPTGQPVSNARIYVESDLFWGVFDDLHKILSDEQGRWAIPALAAGTYRFTARHKSFAQGSAEQVVLDGKTPKTEVIIRLEPSGILTGKVQNRRGEGVAGVNVRAAKEGEAPRYAYTDASGAFRMEGLPLSMLRVGAYASEGQIATPAQVDLSGGSAEVTLVLDVDGLISGFVVDSLGKPIPEAQVSATPVNFMSDRKKWSMLYPPSVLSDPDGRFTLQGIKEGAEYLMNAEFPKMKQSDKKEDIVKAKAGDTQVKLVLQSLGGVKGKLQLESGGTPKSFSVFASTEGQSTFADTEGTFEVSGVRPGKQIAYFMGPDFMDKMSSQFEVKPNEVLDLGVIIVTQGRTVRGRVLSDGKPVFNATVVVTQFLSASGGKLDPEDEFNKKERALTGEDGSFVISGLTPDEDLTTVAEHPTLGRSTTQKIPKNKNDVTLEFTLQKGGILEGTVRYNGKPVDATLAAFPVGANGQFSTNTGTDGKYRFDQLAPGDYEVEAFYITEQQFSGQQPSSKTMSVTMEPNKLKKLDIDIPEGINVTVNPTKNRVTTDNTMIYLVSKSVTATNSEELATMTDGLPRAQIRSGQARAWMPGDVPKPVLFRDIPVGAYTICVVQSPSSEEYEALSEAERKAPKPVTCVPKEITAAPKEQEVVIELGTP
jgi:uncharacterized GH25 family protein